MVPRRCADAPSFGRLIARPRAAVGRAAAAVLCYLIAGAAAPYSVAEVGAAPKQVSVCSREWIAKLTPPSTNGLPTLQAAPLIVTEPGWDIQRPELVNTLPRPASPAQGNGPFIGYIRPNDEFFHASQPNLRAIQAPEAWSVSFGHREVAIAVISTGIDPDHEDLAGKIWRNRGEIPGNGIDDDGNGYVDDVSGWDFAERQRGPRELLPNNDNTVDDNDPRDWPILHGGGMGTLSAGIVAAQTHNGIGIAGIAWNATVMPLKALYPADGLVGPAVGYSSDITEAICYAANEGADAILIQAWFQRLDEQSDVEFLLMRDAIGYANEMGAVVIAAAGDCRKASESCGPTDNPAIYPANLNGVVGVQAVSVTRDTLSSASVGPWVDIVAPGGGFITTQMPAEVDSRTYFSVGNLTAGASGIAAAHVAGAVGLLKAVNPNLNSAGMRCALCRRADRGIGGPYTEFSSDGETCGLRNDEFGCGFLNLQATMLGIPWVVRLLPSETTIVAAPEGPIPCRRLENPYLNEGMWEVRLGGAPRWIIAEPVEQAQYGKPSYVEVCVDRDILIEDNGPIQPGSVVTAELAACSLRTDDRDCQRIVITVRFFEDVFRLLMPRLVVW
jgi:subtilisin family serine protease